MLLRNKYPNTHPSKAAQTPKSNTDKRTVQNTAAGESTRSNAHAAPSVVNDMEAEENDAIAEISKTLLKKHQHHDSSVNITCHCSPYIVPARMSRLITETEEKFGMTIAGNVDTVTIFLLPEPSHQCRLA